jgi:hypothetical protein
MFKVRAFIFYLFVLLNINVFSQTRQIGIAFSNNATSSPIIGYPRLFYSKLHPGIDVYLAQKINAKQKNQWWVFCDASFFNHRFFQTALKLNLGVSYNYYFKPRFNAMLGIEGGYLHSLYHYELYKLNNTGDYVKTRGLAGRPQFNVGMLWGFSYGLLKNEPNKLRVFLNFKTFVQGKFAGNYIPLVPYNHVSLGMSYILKPKSGDNEK